jgi:twinkle protein|tara:strand:+ start:1091 stop:2836 length:1746 start_codon:yes stop_codon:yes gene_type:complete
MSNDQGVCHEKLGCPECGSSDGLQVFQKEDDSFDGFCYACPQGGRFVRDPYKTGVPLKEGTRKIKRDDTELLEEASQLPFNSLPHRGLSKQVCEEYGVRVALSAKDGKTVVAEYYPDTKAGATTGWEVKSVEKKGFYGIGDRRGSLELWGTATAKKSGGRKLWITEGRSDAMALYQSLRKHTATKWKHLIPSVVSLTRGAGGAVKDLLNNRKFVDSYDEVILVFDNDSVGIDAVEQVLKTFPLAKVVELPQIQWVDEESGEVKTTKDANDYVMGGMSQELYDQTMWKASIIRQGEVVDVSDFIEDALIKPSMGIGWPWPSATKATFGIRPHTIHIIGAAPKIGKTDHEHQLIEHLVFKENQKVGVFDFENPPAKTAKKVASKHHKIDYTRPDAVYNDEDLRRGLMAQQGLVRFYDRRASREWDSVKIALEEMHLLDNINIFIIDPLTAFVSMYTSSEANDALNAIMTEMADLVMKYPITLLCYTHVNPKPKSSTPHEKGGSVLSGEFTGSRAMEKWSHYAWGIRRDRSPDCPQERKNMSTFELLYDREFGQSAAFDVYFDEPTVTYLEPTRLIAGGREYTH